MAGILETTLVGDLAATKGRVISVPDTSTVQEVLSTLLANNITAVPIAGSVSSVTDGSTHYIGFVSILDIVLHIADNLGQPEKELGILAVNIIGQSCQSRTLWTLSPTEKLLQAMEPLSKGINHFLVPSESLADVRSGLDDSSPKYKLLTQTDIIRFLLQNLDYLGPIVTKTVADLGLVEAGQSPIAVPLNMPVVDVLRLMREEDNVTAMAVVGIMDGVTPGSQPRAVRGGKILGTISVSDFRGLTSDTLRSLTEVTVEQFLKSMSGVAVPKPPVTCRVNTPLGTLMGIAVTSKVHRIWVTNEDGWLTGVVTFSDIIRVIRQDYKVAVLNC